MVDILPRLSSRLLHSFYGTSVPTCDELAAARTASYASLKSVADEDSFSVGLFLSPQNSFERNNVIKEKYDEFTELLSKLLSNAETQSKSAQVLFNIIDKAPSVDVAFDQANGHFGDLNIELFAQISEVVKTLKGFLKGKELSDSTFQHMKEIQYKSSASSTLNDALFQGICGSAADFAANYEQLEELDANSKKHILSQQESADLLYAQALEESFAQENGNNNDWLAKLGFTEQYLQEERALGLQKNQKFQSWTEGLAEAGSRQYYEKKGLPAGAVRKTSPGIEEVFIPAPKRPNFDHMQDELIPIDSLEPWAQEAFRGTKRLNPIQSKVFPCAYYSTENMLVCAPTGAGKTNIAMLAILQQIRAHMTDSGEILKDNFKIVYIAPMKALAQEVVTKFSERLKPLGLLVREYTGDMQLTKSQLTETQILVCTPEKYDVATRKGGEGSFAHLVTLILIDEVHLLADERGAVIETIVARTNRLVESNQKLIRIVGLSATLPNYHDVAKFLGVNLSTGLYYFGSEFRPVPLDQSFIGITEKSRVKCLEYMTRQAYEKMIASLELGKQVMIFVHSRRDTSKTIEAILELCAKYATYSYLENVHHEKYTMFKKIVDKSKSKEVQSFFGKGVGIHHAGMLRNDRNLTEQLFEQGLIKVLCCTATLAWGVNLPAHTVIIKGTELYDPERGGFVDLSILDVFQIFGRAGRPQYDNCGYAVLITQHKSLAMYLGLLAAQTPIESNMIKSLADHMNAEIVNGTVNNVKEAIQWISYTFLFIRMKLNPLIYGCTYEEMYADPQLEKKREQLVRDAAQLLDSCMMIRYDPRSGNLAATDLGRIASYYYIKYSTIQGFNSMLSPHVNDMEAFHALCSATEFDQLKIRPEEMSEMDSLRKHTFVQIKATNDDTSGKVNLLLQGYLAHLKINSFTLQSDTNYVAQNAGRIARALFEICLKRGWSTLSLFYISLCKFIDKRITPGQTPLRQFLPDIPGEVIKRIEELNANYHQLKDMNAKELGSFVHNQKFGPQLKQYLKYLPLLNIEVTVKPITKGILKLGITLETAFTWHDYYHGAAESFWLWIEDSDNEYIYHSEYYLLQKQQRNEGKFIEVTIPVRDPLPSQYYVRVVSDIWVGCETLVEVPFHDVLLPSMQEMHTNLLDCHPVPVSALQDPLYESLYDKKFSHFNPVQSQVFHVLYNTNRNCLVGAPTGSGKTIMAELAILRLLKHSPGFKTVYVAPLKALARERLADWKKKLSGQLGLDILELTGEFTPSTEALRKAHILIVTPEKWDSISRGWQKRDYVKSIGLMVIDEIHLLGADRGPVLEVIVSRMRFISAQTGNQIRFVGLSTALANAQDLGAWLGIEEGTTSGGARGLFNFRPSVRPVPMNIHIQGFPGRHYCPRMATMNKPAYSAILEHSPFKPVLIFVSSRRQTRLTALDIIACCASDEHPKRFLHMDEDDMTQLTTTIKDKALKDTLAFGIGIHHAGLDSSDRDTVETLFAESKIQILVCTSTLAWGVNLPAHMVIVKGTEFFDGKTKTYIDFPVTDILQMMGRAGRPQFDDHAVACIFVQESKKNFYRKFLHEPFPVESSLHHQLWEHFNAEISNGTLHSLYDVIEYLTWTYFFRRLLMNPTYYGLISLDSKDVQKYLYQLVLGTCTSLQQAGCIDMAIAAAPSTTSTSTTSNTPFIATNYELSCTSLGMIASYYYLDYKTPKFFQDAFKKLQTTSTAGAGGFPLTASTPLALEFQFLQIVEICVSAYEFSEIPVRHNEEFLNHDLAIELGLMKEEDEGQPLHPIALLKRMDSSHTKALLLLLAYLQGSKLPITDYINDTKTVMDQLPRVLSAMIDIAADSGYSTIVQWIVYFSQLLKQKLSWKVKHLLSIDDATNPLQWKQVQLHPVIVEDLARQQQRYTSIASLSTLSTNQLHTLLTGCYRKYASAKDTTLVMPSRLVDMMMKIPSILLHQARIRSLSSTGASVEDESVATTTTTATATAARDWKEGGSDAHALSFPMNGQCEVEVQVRTLRTVSSGGSGSSTGKNDISWWVLLFASNERRTDRELLSIRKISISSYANTTTTVKMTFPTPIVPSQVYLDVQLINDMYIGIQQSIVVGKLIAS